jgi:hypothetical protein
LSWVKAGLYFANTQNIERIRHKKEVIGEAFQCRCTASPMPQPLRAGQHQTSAEDSFRQKPGSPGQQESSTCSNCITSNTSNTSTKGKTT